MAYDLFVSYARADAERIEAITRALRDAGLRVWLDRPERSDFANMMRAITGRLAQSKTLLAFYSKAFPTHRTCQWELTAAFLAAEHGRDPRARLLLLNPESTADHIQPAELRQALFGTVPEPHDEQALRQLAAAVKQTTDSVSGVLAEVCPLARPTWHGERGLGSERFVGRAQSLWDLHAALSANDVAVVTGQASDGRAQVRGIEGIGKSLLAEEYALRFGAAYPGGVFWLSGHAHDSEGAVTAARLAADRERQSSALATTFGVEVGGLRAAEIVGALERELRDADKPYLWVVDDLPLSVGAQEYRQWFAPNGLGKTLITTRSHTYDVIGGIVDLGVLEEREGYELLTTRRTPADAEEEQAARGIVETLGCHALALDVAGGALAWQTERETFAGFHAKIWRPASAALAAAAELGVALPNGHQRSIANALICSVELLGEPTRDFLRLASVLGGDPIPVDLVDGVFQRLADVSDSGIADPAEEAVKHCLAEHAAANIRSTEEGDELSRSYAVHALLRHTMRFYDRDSSRHEQLRALAVETLSDILLKVSDGNTRSRLHLHAAHARHLTSHPEDVTDAMLLGWVGRSDFAGGAYTAARVCQEATLEALRRLLGDEHPDTLTSMVGLADTLFAEGNLSGARELEETVLEARTRLLGRDHPDTLTSINNLAGTLRAQGDSDGARKLQEAVSQALRRVAGEKG